MIDYMLVVVLIGILVIIYRQMIKVDDVLDTIEHPDVLVIYEDQYKDIKKYVFDDWDPLFCLGGAAKI